MLPFPLQNGELVKQFESQNATVFAMDQIPRTLSRGQAFDALSSQANIAGYRSVIEVRIEATPRQVPARPPRCSEPPLPARRPTSLAASSRAR